MATAESPGTITLTSAPINHIGIDEKGVARIIGSRSRVIDIVLDVRARGWTPEDIAREYPHLSLAKIHAALSYYHDHKAELDLDIERRHREVERMRAESGESGFARRMRAEGRIK